MAASSTAIAMATAIMAAAGWTGGLSGQAAGPAASGSWTVYHGNPAGTGDARPVVAVYTAKRAWTSRALDGEIYGEPLLFAGRVYVATENDTVYALSAATGAVAWSAHLASPVPSGDLPCGDISPTVGITGTPVIDPARDEIFAVADELTRGAPAHVLVGLSAATGKTEMTQDVDPAGADTAALLQRTGLTLDDGRVVFGMGGNFGDCASYRGRVVAAPETGGRPLVFTVDAGPGESQGAVWMGGAAPVVDADGDIWVSTGNGSVYSSSHAYDDSDAVLELSPTMRLLQYFAPSNWPANNSQDLDMSTAPVLLPDGQVMLAGKSRIVYLLDGARLGGIGRQLASLGSACSADIDGGIALAGLTAYLPCASGVIAVRATRAPPGLRLLWTAPRQGGPPVAAAGLIWTIGQNGTLYGLDPGTGAVRQQAFIGAVANHFPTPAVAGGLLLAPAARDVVAFSAPSAAAPSSSSPSPAPSGHAASPAPAAPGGPAAGGIAGITVAGLAILGGLGWLLWRRRRIGHN
ncbi:MAG TPA: PQQ-binding-like beta-propeller repeat protein [Streptosporangiaceae bacterium]|nr:PQQ-binding-like beta-propeller repeat protein [Streptosporangiaceae bacterium]